MAYRVLVYKSVLIDAGLTTNHHKTFCEYDPLLGWKHRENVRARFVTNEYDALLEFNSKGFRGGEVPYEKGSDTYRILILGNSFAESYTVNLEDSFSEVLKKGIAGKIKNKVAEVINFGVGGYSTDQQFLYMQKEGQRYRPDLTVVMFSENDVYYNVSSRYWRGFKPYFILENGNLVLKNNPVPRPQIGPEQNNIIRFLPKSYLFSYLIDSFRAQVSRKRCEMRGGQKIRFIKYDRNMQNSWMITGKIIHKLKLLVDSINADILVVYIPPADLVANVPDKNGALIDKDKPRRILSDICANQGIPFLDLTKELQVMGAGQRLYFRCDGHWNKKGHELVGKILAQYIEKMIQQRYNQP